MSLFDVLIGWDVEDALEVSLDTQSLLGSILEFNPESSRTSAREMCHISLFWQNSAPGLVNIESRNATQTLCSLRELASLASSLT